MRKPLTLFLLGSTLLLAACQTSGTTWPDFQAGLRPGPSSSPVKAVLPADLALAPPAATDAVKADYAGVWEGWMCADATNDIKIAVVAVDDQGATLEYAAGATSFGQFNQRLSARFVEDQSLLRAQFTRGDLLFLAKRPDGHLDVRFNNWRGGMWCTGILERTRTAPTA